MLGLVRGRTFVGLTAVAALVAVAAAALGQTTIKRAQRGFEYVPHATTPGGEPVEYIVPVAQSNAMRQGCPWAQYHPDDPNFVPLLACATNEGDPNQDRFWDVSQEQVDAGSTTICTFSDLTAGEDGLRVADNFYFFGSGEVWGVSWWGTMAQQEVEPNGQCTMDDQTPDYLWAPVDYDDWTIRYFTEDPANPGWPLEPAIVEFTGVGPGVATGTYSRTIKYSPSGYPMVMPTGIGDLAVYEMNYTFAPGDHFAVNGLETYFIEITSNYTHNECFFCWGVCDPSWDLRSLQRDEGDPWDPNAADPQDTVYDVAVCQEFCGPPTPQPPRITVELDGLPEQDTDCCTFRFRVINQNSIDAGPLTRFWMAVEKGDGEDPGDCGEDLSEIIPPVGYDVEYCETWKTTPQTGSRGAIYTFTGGEIPEGQWTFGHIKLRVNDRSEDELNDENTVQGFGVRMWGSNSQGDAAVPVDLGLCGTGQFGPLENPVPVGAWSTGEDGICDIHPIPAMSAVGKVLLALLLIGAGLFLVLRSRRVAVS